MKRFLMAALCIVSMCGVFSTVRAEGLLSINIGPIWPQALLSTGAPSWDGELEVGALIDKRIGFGFACDFLWNVRTRDVLDTSTNHYRITNDEKTFMFPLMGFFMIDPVPNLIVHPVGTFQIGYNQMIYNVKTDNTTLNTQKTVSPYFYGLIIKVGVDAVYNLGERAAIFAGLEFQWANTKTTDTQSGLFDKRDMSGIGIHAGFRI
jgi:hypothetical protein